MNDESQKSSSQGSTKKVKPIANFYVNFEDANVLSQDNDSPDASPVIPKSSRRQVLSNDVPEELDQNDNGLPVFELKNQDGIDFSRNAFSKQVFTPEHQANHKIAAALNDGEVFSDGDRRQVYASPEAEINFNESADDDLNEREEVCDIDSTPIKNNLTNQLENMRARPQALAIKHASSEESPAIKIRGTQKSRQLEFVGFGTDPNQAETNKNKASEQNSFSSQALSNRSRDLITETDPDKRSEFRALSPTVIDNAKRMSLKHSFTMGHSKAEDAIKVQQPTNTLMKQQTNFLDFKKKKVNFAIDEDTENSSLEKKIRDRGDSSENHSQHSRHSVNNAAYSYNHKMKSSFRRKNIDDLSEVCQEKHQYSIDDKEHSVKDKKSSFVASQNRRKSFTAGKRMSALITVPLELENNAVKKNLSMDDNSEVMVSSSSSESGTSTGEDTESGSDHKDFHKAFNESQTGSTIARKPKKCKFLCLSCNRGSYIEKLNFEDFQQMYSEGPVVKEGSPTTCIIMSNNPYKIIWDVMILLLLTIICFIVPYRLAFAQDESKELQAKWDTAYDIIDCFFALDIILTFFTSVSDEQHVSEIINKKQIAVKYINSWFFVDLLSVIPFQHLFEDSEHSTSDINALARFARLGKLYKLIRLTRLAKVLKLLKSQNSVMGHFSSKLKINQGCERLIFFILMYSFFFHIAACMFVFLSQFENNYEESWHYTHTSGADQTHGYSVSMYYVITTMATVGYGDIYANTDLERVFCMILMIIGVVAFNFISGALSSLISVTDSQHADYQEKLIFLNKLRSQYSISDQLYFEVKRALNFDSKSNAVIFDELIENLPVNLKLEICSEIHRDTFINFPLFKNLGNKNFLAWVGSRFKSRLVTESTNFYLRGDPIVDYFFTTKGISGFMTGKDDRLFALINPSQYKRLQKKDQNRSLIMQSFGVEDSIINATALVHDENYKSDAFLFSNNGFKTYNKRYFTVMSVTNMECLSLSFTDIERMKRDFNLCSKEFFKFMAKQTQTLLHLHIYANKNIYQTPKIERFRVSRVTNRKSKTLQEQNVERVLKAMQNFDQLAFLEQREFSLVSFDKMSSESMTEDAEEDKEEQENQDEQGEQEDGDGEKDDDEADGGDAKLENTVAKSQNKSLRSQKSSSQAAGSPLLKNSIQTPYKMLMKSELEKRRHTKMIKKSEIPFEEFQEQGDNVSFTSNSKSSSKRDSRSKKSSGRGAADGIALPGMKKTQSTPYDGSQLNSSSMFGSKKIKYDNMKILDYKNKMQSFLSSVRDKSSRRGSISSSARGSDRSLGVQSQKVADNSSRSANSHLKPDDSAADMFDKMSNMSRQRRQTQQLTQSPLQKKLTFGDKKEKREKRHTANKAGGESPFQKKEVIFSVENAENSSSDTSSEELERSDKVKSNLEISQSDLDAEEESPKKTILKPTGAVNLHATEPRQDPSGDRRISMLTDANLLPMKSFNEKSGNHNDPQRRNSVKKAPSIGLVDLTESNHKEVIIQTSVYSENPFDSQLKSQIKAQAGDKHLHSIQEEQEETNKMDLLSKTAKTSEKKVADLYADRKQSVHIVQETELQLTRRLLEENPRGMEGLVYTLHELRKAKANGTIKLKTRITKEDKSATSRVAGIMGMNKCQTKVTMQERDHELICNLKFYKDDVLEYLMREVTENAQVTFIEKSEKFMQGMLENQQKKLESYLGRISIELSGMREEINSLKDQSQQQQQSARKSDQQREQRPQPSLVTQSADIN